MQNMKTRAYPIGCEAVMELLKYVYPYVFSLDTMVHIMFMGVCYYLLSFGRCRINLTSLCRHHVAVVEISTGWCCVKKF